MSDDKRLSIVDALRVAREQIAEQRADANNTMIDCDRTLRMIDGALQRHEEESCQTEASGASVEATSGNSMDYGESSSDGRVASDAESHPESLTSVQPSQPAEPEAVSRLRQWMNAPEGDRSILICLLREMAGGSLTHIDTLSARLKRAETLLGAAEDLLPPFIATRNAIAAFLAGKEPT